MISKDLLQNGGVDALRAELYAAPLDAACSEFSIQTTNEICAWLAQLVVESSYFKILEENLNYSAQGLANTWPARFYMTPNGIPDATAARGREWAPTYARQPQLIANVVYANRMGNGDTDSGDGWKYRGRGLPQITGKDEYMICGATLKLDLVNNPDLLLEPAYAARAAGWFWKWKDAARMYRISGFEGVCRTWNGGILGLSSRQKAYNQFCDALSIAPL